MKPSLWVKTDLNAFFGLALDNVAVLILLLGLISGTESLKEQVDSGRFVFSPDFVVSHMIPGTALGVLVGDLAFSVMGFFLARRLGRTVTSMPLGLDTPSTFGMAFLVLLPALTLGHQKFPDDATAAPIAKISSANLRSALARRGLRASLAAASDCLVELAMFTSCLLWF